VRSLGILFSTEVLIRELSGRDTDFGQLDPGTPWKFGSIPGLVLRREAGALHVHASSVRLRL